MSIDDDYGQVDGEGSPFAPSPFARGMRGAPWLQPPWHMWGTTEQIAVPLNGPLLVIDAQRAGKQLAKINYGRPDTWDFLFWGRIISAPDATLISSIATRLVFTVTVGVGRASVPLAGFETFQWEWPGSPPLNVPRWSTIGNRPPRSDSPVDTAVHEIRDLVAQDIQVSAEVIVTTGIGPASPVVVEAGAFFAPKVHVRPDWLMIDAQPEAQFPGNEVGGR
jgi:hypothetical protein